MSYLLTAWLILQQIPRKRKRPQDIYDLSRLIIHEAIDADAQALILGALKEKSRARGIDPKQDSLNDPEIKRRCEAGWQSLKLEIAEVPDLRPALQILQRSTVIFPGKVTSDPRKSFRRLSGNGLTQPLFYFMFATSNIHRSSRLIFPVNGMYFR